MCVCTYVLGCSCTCVFLCASISFSLSVCFFPSLSFSLLFTLFLFPFLFYQNRGGHQSEARGWRKERRGRGSVEEERSWLSASDEELAYCPEREGEGDKKKLTEEEKKIRVYGRSGGKGGQRDRARKKTRSVRV